MESPGKRRLSMRAAPDNPPKIRCGEPTIDNPDVEEISLLLYVGEMRELFEAARHEGLTAAGLVRYLIRDYLAWTRSELGRALGRRRR